MSETAKTAPAKFKFRWYVARVLGTLITLLLGISGVFAGSMMVDESGTNHLKGLAGWLCSGLGVIMGFIGLVFFAASFIDAAGYYIGRTNKSEPIDW